MYVRERAWLFRHFNAQNAISVLLCVPVVNVRTKEKRGGCVIRPTASESLARDTREKGAQMARKETNVTSEPTARPVRPGLGGRRWWNGWTGGMNGGFCGAGLALALSLTGEGSVIWAVLIRSRRCGEREKVERAFYSLALFSLWKEQLTD